MGEVEERVGGDCKVLGMWREKRLVDGVSRVFSLDASGRQGCEVECGEVCES